MSVAGGTQRIVVLVRSVIMVGTKSGPDGTRLFPPERHPVDSIVVAVVSGVVAPIVAVAAWAVALRSDTAAELISRATGAGPIDHMAPDAPPASFACGSCGKPYPPTSSAVFCRHCGRRLKDDPAPSTGLPRTGLRN